LIPITKVRRSCRDGGRSVLNDSLDGASTSGPSAYTTRKERKIPRISVATTKKLKFASCQEERKSR